MALVSQYILNYVMYKIADASEFYDYLEHTTFCLFSTASDNYQGGYNTYTFEVQSPPLILPCNVVVTETIDSSQNQTRKTAVWSSANGKFENITWSVDMNDLNQIDMPIRIYQAVPANTYQDIGFRIF